MKGEAKGMEKNNGMAWQKARQGQQKTWWKA